MKTLIITALLIFSQATLGLTWGEPIAKKPTIGWTPLPDYVPGAPGSTKALDELYALTQAAKANPYTGDRTLASNPRIAPTFIGSYLFTLNGTDFTALGEMVVGEKAVIHSFTGEYTMVGGDSVPFESTEVLIDTFDRGLIIGRFFIDNQPINFSIKMSKGNNQGVINGNVQNSQYTGTILKDQ